MGKGGGQGQAQSVGQLGEAWSGFKQENCLESTELTSAEALGPGLRGDAGRESSRHI